jgi:hypothetical protein
MRMVTITPGMPVGALSKPMEKALYPTPAGLGIML